MYYFLRNTYFFLKIFLKFIFREGEGRRKRETSVCGCPSHTPYWGPGPQCRHVPRPGIKLVTLWFTGVRSIHWATPARATINFNITSCQSLFKYSHIVKYLNLLFFLKNKTPTGFMSFLVSIENNPNTCFLWNNIEF